MTCDVNRPPTLSRQDHPRCHSASWICMYGHANDVVIFFKFHQNSWKVFRALWGHNLPFPIGFYSSRESAKSVLWRCRCRRDGDVVATATVVADESVLWRCRCRRDGDVVATATVVADESVLLRCRCRRDGDVVATATVVDDESDCDWAACNIIEPSTITHWASDGFAAWW